MLPKLRPLLVGAATFIPGMRRLLTAARESLGLGGSASARYCYSVWLRHVVTLAESGLWKYPQTVAELGPGDSLGIGLCALLTGADSYYAFDVMRFASSGNNIAVFDELVALFNSRAPIPNEQEFPEITPRITSYDFPFAIFPNSHLDETLATARMERIRAAVLTVGAGGTMISYEPNWHHATARIPRFMDLIYSQAVLEHVADLEATYRVLNEWLAPEGVMSHSVDFRCHNMFSDWNGHWTVPEAIWKIVFGKRVYLLNREPCSRHLQLLASTNFQVLAVDKYYLASKVGPHDLAPRFKHIDAEDLTIAMATIQAQRGPEGDARSGTLRAQISHNN